MYGLRYNIKSDYIIRNWAQVKYSDAIFAIGKILQPGDKLLDRVGETRIALIPQVKGGTGYAVQMGINEGKPVYVYDASQNGWFRYDYTVKNFIATETPVLTQNFAGIGSRSLATNEQMEMAKSAIKDVYEKTFKASATTSTKKTINIYAGTGENAELSNFAKRPFTHKGYKFSSVEAAYQAMKIEESVPVDIDNTAIMERLTSSNITGAEAKKLGRQIKGLDIQHWDRRSSAIMEELIRKSFEQNPDALEKLLATGDAVLTHTQDNTKWKTEFPKLLMEVREELKTSVTPSTEPTIPENVPESLIEESPIYLETNGGNYYKFELRDGTVTKGWYRQGTKTEWKEMVLKKCCQ